MPFGEAPDDNAEERFGSLIELAGIFTRYSVCVVLMISING